MVFDLDGKKRYANALKNKNVDLRAATDVFEGFADEHTDLRAVKMLKKASL